MMIGNTNHTRVVNQHSAFIIQHFPSMPSDVVISYSSRDRVRVLEIVERLRGEGLGIWLDQGGIEGATLWGEEIFRAIEGCKVLVLALSKHSAESQNVVKEVSLALERNKSILPINLEPVDVPSALRYPLAGIQRLDMHGAGMAEGLVAMTRALARLGVGPAIAPEPAQPAAGTAQKPLNDKLIAVLPFVNISPDKESDYFSDGLTEELIAALSQLKGMSVISRTNSMRYKGTTKDIESIGRELSSRYIVEGTVRRHHEDLRITAELIDVATTAQLWAHIFKGKMADVFDIQEEVAKHIVDALRLTVSPKEKIILTKRSTSNAEAYDLFLRARDLLYRFTRTNVEQAIEVFAQAIAIDPRYAAAHGGLAQARAFLHLFFDRNDASLELATDSAMRALMYDAGVSEAYNALALVQLARQAPEEALESAQKSVELDPENYPGHYILGRVFLVLDRFADSVRAFERVIELNRDFYPGWIFLQQAEDKMGHAERSRELVTMMISLFPQYLARHPDDATAHGYFAQQLARVGQRDDAIVEIDTALALAPDDANILYNAACCLAQLGERSRAVESLARAVDRGYRFFEWIKRDPDFDAIREEPGYLELMKSR
jgi:TolB-like protein/cytochrome c-type biogenesis protein CcmH/NrfG